MKKFKEFLLREAEGMNILEADMLNIRKKLPGGHTGYFDVDERGEVYQKLIPKGMTYNQVKFGSRMDPKVVHPSIGVAWMNHVNKKLVPRAQRMADVTGQPLKIAGVSSVIHRYLARGVPKTFKDYFGELTYKPTKRKLSFSGVHDAVSYHLRQKQESDRLKRIAGEK